MPLEDELVRAWRRCQCAAREACHELAKKAYVIFGFIQIFGALEADLRKILPQARQWPFAQKSGEIIGGVRKQFAASDADEEIEEFALQGLGDATRGGFGKAAMRAPKRRHIAF